MRRADRTLEAWYALGALGALSIATPFLARGLGLEVDVPRRTEVVDHVVPGVVVLAASTLALFAAMRERSGLDGALLGCAAACMLSGLFELTTHVPLLADAARGDVGWDAALFMSAAGPVILVISFRLLWLEMSR